MGSNTYNCDSKQVPCTKVGAEGKWQQFVWDEKEVLLEDYLKNSATINAEYCYAVVTKLRENIMKMVQESSPKP